MRDHGQYSSLRVGLAGAGENLDLSLAAYLSRLGAEITLFRSLPGDLIPQEFQWPEAILPEACTLNSPLCDKELEQWFSIESGRRSVFFLFRENSLALDVLCTSAPSQGTEFAFRINTLVMPAIIGLRCELHPWSSPEAFLLDHPVQELSRLLKNPGTAPEAEPDWMSLSLPAEPRVIHLSDGIMAMAEFGLAVLEGAAPDHSCLNASWGWAGSLREALTDQALEMEALGSRLKKWEGLGKRLEAVDFLFRWAEERRGLSCSLTGAQNQSGDQQDQFPLFSGDSFFPQLTPGQSLARSLERILVESEQPWKIRG